MTYKLIDLANVIRSKNSGPYELTFDIIFKNKDIYEKVCKSNAINKSSFAKLYNIDEKTIMEIVHFNPSKAIKITIERPISSGQIGETDVYGAQQHVPLLAFEVEI